MGRVKIWLWVAAIVGLYACFYVVERGRVGWRRPVYFPDEEGE